MYLYMLASLGHATARSAPYVFITSAFGQAFNRLTRVFASCLGPRVETKMVAASLVETKMAAASMAEATVVIAASVQSAHTAAGHGLLHSLSF